MKKQTALLIALLLAGCAAQDTPWSGDDASPGDRPFTTQAVVEWRQKRYDATITRTPDAGVTVTLSSGDLKTPVTLHSGAGAVEMTMDARSIRLSDADAPSGGLAPYLERTLSGLTQCPTQSLGETRLARDGDAALTLDAHTGAYCKLETPQTRIVFSSFTFSETPR